MARLTGFSRAILGGIQVNNKTVLATVIVVGVMSFAAAPRASASSMSIQGHTPKFTADSLDLGAENGSRPLHLRIWLKMHQPDQLKQMALVAQRSRRYLTKSDVDGRFKPKASEVKRVEKYLAARGLKNIKAHPGRRYVEADATVADAQRLFQVEIHRYLVNGQTMAANTSDPQVDSEIAGQVAYIGGLSHHIMRPMARRPVDPDTGAALPAALFTKAMSGTQHNTVCFSDPETHQFTTSGAAQPQATYSGNRYGGDVTKPAPALPPCGYGPAEIQSAYGVDKLKEQGLDGSGETVVIVDAYGSPTIQGDAADFSQSFGLPAPQLTVYQPSGVPVTGPWTADQQGWAGETTLDVEYAHVMAPGAKIALVEAMTASDSDLAAAIAYALENNLGNQISNSWSGNESQEDQASIALWNLILQEAVARGVSIHFSSGDDGDLVKSVGYADVGYPSSSPLVTSVGGTTLALNADHTVRFHAGWGNNLLRIADSASSAEQSAAGQNQPLDPPNIIGFSGGAGGGASRVYPKPDFQSSITGPGRMQPDIGFLADPYTGVEIVQSSFDAKGSPQPGQLTLSVIGGTSLACPMFTGLWAVANQAHGSSLGQAAPLLYNLPDDAIIDVLPVTSATNVSGAITDSKGVNQMTPVMLAMPQTAEPFYSAFYDSPNSPFRWYVISFGTDTSLPVTPGWDGVTGLGVPNGLKFVEALQ